MGSLSGRAVRAVVVSQSPRESVRTCGEQIGGYPGLACQTTFDTCVNAGSLMPASLCVSTTRVGFMSKWVTSSNETPRPSAQILCGYIDNRAYRGEGMPSALIRSLYQPSKLRRTPLASYPLSYIKLSWASSLVSASIPSRTISIGSLQERARRPLTVQRVREYGGSRCACSTLFRGSRVSSDQFLPSPVRSHSLLHLRWL